VLNTIPATSTAMLAQVVDDHIIFEAGFQKLVVISAFRFRQIRCYVRLALGAVLLFVVRAALVNSSAQPLSQVLIVVLVHENTIACLRLGSNNWDICGTLILLCLSPLLLVWHMGHRM
jgi:hypothetical protein